MRSHKLAAEPNLAVSCSRRLQVFGGNGLMVIGMMLGFENSIAQIAKKLQRILPSCQPLGLLEQLLLKETKHD
jgi:hypothetical protein